MRAAAGRLPGRQGGPSHARTHQPLTGNGGTGHAGTGSTGTGSSGAGGSAGQAGTAGGGAGGAGATPTTSCQKGKSGGAVKAPVFWKNFGFETS
ncbi:MAG TPA: hypothetical protein VF331_14130 [Polyangiales bacterium]